LVFLACVGLAIGTTIGFSWARETYFDGLHVRFIGGLDSNLVIFLLSLVILLFVASTTLEHGKPAHGPQLSVAFLIPAHNEARDLAECIRAIDAAAVGYPGGCKLYVVDNDSSDNTRAVAREVLAQCHSVKGEVLLCPTPGKSRALNLGLSRITDDVVIRIDADTIVSPSLLGTVVPWFWDESVGGVSGLPLPNEATPRWLYPLRIAEVYYGVAFLRVAQGAADAIMVMPGMIAAYRRTLVEELGGFAEGINGEDADITMRIGRLGYRIVTDLDVRVRTEVPETLAHLREQRQRWARGLFHMAGRNMSTIWMRQGLRGLWILPWSIFNASRRSMMIPILVCALVVELLDPTVFALREVSVVAGFLVGLQLVVISVLLVAYRQFAAMPFVPAYLLFRMFRAYTAFETLLTLRLKPSPAEAGAVTTPSGQLSGAGSST
jgi:cellulose synthase/poly-beta-1,6-N-acetylglucosamine synthase-like glycosyltransferase